MLRAAFFLILIGLASEGCSSGPHVRMGTDPDIYGNVDPAVYGAGTFSYSKPMIERPSTDRGFFGSCTQSGHQSWYSKTDYSCDYP